MTKKKKDILIGIGICLLLGGTLSFNIYTFIGIKTRTGYTYGTIIENFESGKRRHEYSRYQYQVNGITYKGRQGENLVINSAVIIVYDLENPKYSMVARYAPPIIKQNGDTIPINENYVKYRWWDYLPADNISDLWK